MAIIGSKIYHEYTKREIRPAALAHGPAKSQLKAFEKLHEKNAPETRGIF